MIENLFRQLIMVVGPLGDHYKEPRLATLAYREEEHVQMLAMEHEVA